MHRSPAGALVTTPMSATVVEIGVAIGDVVVRDRVVAIVEAMKMEHELRSTIDGVVAEVFAIAGDVVEADAVLMRIIATGETTVSATTSATTSVQPAATGLRPELSAAIARHALTLDAARPAAMAAGDGDKDWAALAKVAHRRARLDD